MEFSNTLAEYSYQLRNAIERLPAIDAAVMKRAAEMGIAEEVDGNVKARFVAAVMEKLGKELQDAGKEVRYSCEDTLMTLMMMLDSKTIEIPGVCKMTSMTHNSSSFDKAAAVQALVAAGVDVDVVARAFEIGEKRSSKEIIRIYWAKKKGV